MKLIIEVDEKRFEEIKQIANAQFELKNKTEAQIIANGTPYNPSGDLISREALKKAIEEVEDNYDGYEPNDLGKFINEVYDLIDNAPTIPLPSDQIAWEQGYEAGLAQGKNDRPKGEWRDASEKNIFYEEVKCFECSICHKKKVMNVLIYEKLPFCPNCGADMKGGAE